jgi:hypothetical protein
VLAKDDLRIGMPSDWVGYVIHLLASVMYDGIPKQSVVIVLTPMKEIKLGYVKGEYPDLCDEASHHSPELTPAIVTSFDNCIHLYHSPRHYSLQSVLFGSCVGGG